MSDKDTPAATPDPQPIDSDALASATTLEAIAAAVDIPLTTDLHHRAHLPDAPTTPPASSDD